MKLGFALNNLGGSQLNFFLIKTANAALRTNPLLDVTAFFENHVQTCLPANFSIMPVYEAWGYTGSIIATSFTTAQKLAGFPSPKKRFFYVWDLEWTRRFNRRTYSEWAAVYGDPTLPLIARGKDHARAIEDAWNRPVTAIVEDCNVGQLLEVVTQ